MSDFKIYAYLFLILNGLGLGLKAQDYRVDVRHIGVKEGLLHREVNAIHQDQKDGFLWLATPLGLNRYDGHRFKYFTQKNYPFQTNRFDMIREDQAGRLWLIGLGPLLRRGNLASIDILDPQTDRAFTFEDIFPDNKHFQVKDLRPMCLYGPKGELIFQHANTSQIYFYSIERGFREFPLAELPPITLQVISPSGSLWGQIDEKDWVELGQDGKLIRKVSFSQKNAATYTPEVHPGGFFMYEKSEPPEVVCIDWQGNKSSLGSTSWERVNHASPNLRFLSSLLLEDSTRDYTGTVDLKIEAQVKSYFIEREGDYLRSYLKTAPDEVWVGGNFGVYQVQVYPNPFTNYLAIPYEESSRMGRIPCRGLAVKGQRLIVNEEPLRTHFVDMRAGSERSLGIDTRDTMGNWAVQAYGPENYLIGRSTSLLQVNRQGELLNEWFRVSDAWAIYQENDQHLWLGLGDKRGIAWFNPQNGKARLAADDPVLAPLRGKSVIHIGADKQNRVWICSDEGLFVFHPQDSSFQYYGITGEGKNYLPTQKVSHFYQDQDSIFWLATLGDGLIRWDEKRGIFRQFMREDGLANNTLYAVYEDEHHHLWMPSDYGIIQFDKATYQSKTYLPKDGTSDIEFNRLSHTQGEDGRLYFGSLNGVSSFHPNDFYFQEESQKARPRLTISAFYQFDGEQNELIDKRIELLHTQTISVRPQDQHFILQFALLTFGEVSLNQYMWRLEGWSDNWQVLDKPEIQLSKLPFGNYELQIRARTAAGEEAANELNIAVKVIPPFYQTNAFILLCILTAVAMIAILLLWRFRQLRKAQQKLEQKVAEATLELREMDRLKSRLFANVSHELRTPLSLILGPISSALKRKKLDEKDASYLQMARQHAQGLQKLISEILDLGKLESGKLTVEEIPVKFSAFLQKTVASFRTIAESEGQEFVFETNLPIDSFLYCDLNHVEKIINNLLSNAIKFTPKGGRISLEVRSQFPVPSSENNQELGTRNFLAISVTDTGPGIHPEDLPFIFDRYYQAKHGQHKQVGGTGIGLALSKELAELMGGSLQAKSKVNEGSVFSFQLPYREALRFRQAPEQVEPEGQLLENPNIKNKAKSTILITEDNKDLRHYLESLLEPDYQVLAVSHGKEALAYLTKQNKPQAQVDLIITDLMMPEMDGFALLEKLKGEKKLCNIPVIMLTARTDISQKLKAFRLGVHDYLTKPFEEEELLVRIENLLQWAWIRKAEKDAHSQEEQVTFSQEDKWLASVNVWLEKHFRSSQIKMLDWAMSQNMSESNFRRKLKLATGLSPHQYLQEYRLQTAHHLLEKQAFTTVAEVAYGIGFSAPDYFSKVFLKRFGKLPSQFFRETSD